MSHAPLIQNHPAHLVAMLGALLVIWLLLWLTVARS